MSKSQLSLRVPVTNSLQNHIIIRGKTLVEGTSDYINIRRRRWNAKKKRDLVDMRFTTLTEMKALENLNSIKSNLKRTIMKSGERKKLLKDALDELEEQKKGIEKTISKAKTFHNNYSVRNKAYEFIVSKVEDYVKLVKEIKRASENERMLLFIGYNMELLVNELDHYEETLGRLVLSQKSFKTKADSLVTKKNVIFDIRKNLNSKLEHDLVETEVLKEKLFRTIYQVRDQTHHALNKVSALQETDVKSMRIVLDIENNMQSMKNRTRELMSDTARFYWFIDWVLNDVIGSWGDIVTGITNDSSSLDKTEAIIDCYKTIKQIISGFIKTNSSDDLRDMYPSNMLT